MAEGIRPNAFVQTNNKEMEAYLQVPFPENEEKYTIAYLQTLLEQNGIRFGISQDALKKIIADEIYNQPVLVAKGKPAVDGIDGYYEFKFHNHKDNKPQVKEDGSVDYWSVNSIQAVGAGDVIAIYHPPVQGSDGINVRGVAVLAKRGKDQAMLKGKGFLRSDDGRTYISEIDGKIEMQGDRIMILAIHEIAGDADISTGNIDFRGDVVIHGNVESGITINATGSITIDGTVEACTLKAGKDIILRRGMLGGHKASVKTKGNIFAKFFENTNIEAEGHAPPLHPAGNCLRRLCRRWTAARAVPHLPFPWPLPPSFPPNCSPSPPPGSMCPLRSLPPWTPSPPLTENGAPFCPASGGTGMRRNCGRC